MYFFFLIFFLILAYFFLLKKLAKTFEGLFWHFCKIKKGGEKKKKKNPKTLKPQNPTAAGTAELTRIFFLKPRNKCIALKLALMTPTAVATRDQHRQAPTTFLSPPPS